VRAISTCIPPIILSNGQSQSFHVEEEKELSLAAHQFCLQNSISSADCERIRVFHQQKCFPRDEIASNLLEGSEQSKDSDRDSVTVTVWEDRDRDRDRECVSGVEMLRDAEKIMISKPSRGVSSALPSPQLTRLRLQRVTRNSREGDETEAGRVRSIGREGGRRE
jgi:hypothetical protein